MRTLTKTITANILTWDELPAAHRELLFYAEQCRRNAQAPYSNYLVGAAVRSASSLYYGGCNVERCSWTQTTHAEQNAVDSLVMREGPSKAVAVAIIGAPRGTEVIFPPAAALTGPPIADISDCPVPCGHCLQIIWENCFGDPDVPLIALAGNGEIVQTTMGDAFPMRFGPEALGIDYGSR